MLYTRSSFIKWLVNVHDCETIPLGIPRENTLLIKNGPATAYINMIGRDVIDYEKIWIICNKLYIVGLPGDNDLIRVE